MKTYHFLALFFVITLAVTSGNLLSNYISVRLVAYGVQQANAAMDVERKRIVDKMKVDLDQKHEAAKKQRSRSKKAQAMWRSCLDWTAMHQQKPTYTTEKESKKQCDIYHRYVDTGV
ncbi:hypothetical protein SAMN05216175_11313 [Neptunomonas qingdaonensis]|uniref:Uncharacterized protein n=1 Tax=Neptunomonas qingdaonensis TaxID=1045558 RepID=A0A1I2UGC2_9GAMM|nr:hypothetical protein SAMN05216175_11313 [Neptunomonas qingdaonensis]